MELVLDTIPETRNPIELSAGHHALVELAAFDDGVSLKSEFEQALEEAITATKISGAVIAQNEQQRRMFWQLRESIPAAEKLSGGSVKHDVSVPIGKLGAYTNEAIAAMEMDFPLSRLSIYGHVGDGNVHFNVLAREREHAVQFKENNAEAISAVIHSMAMECNGSFSAEHGIGKFKREILADIGDPVRLDLMRRIKATLDPKGLMNPGKVL